MEAPAWHAAAPPPMHLLLPPTHPPASPPLVAATACWLRLRARASLSPSAPSASSQAGKKTCGSTTCSTMSLSGWAACCNFWRCQLARPQQWRPCSRVMRRLRLLVFQQRLSRQPFHRHRRQASCSSGMPGRVLGCVCSRLRSWRMLVALQRPVQFTERPGYRAYLSCLPPLPSCFADAGVAGGRGAGAGGVAAGRRAALLRRRTQQRRCGERELVQQLPYGRCACSTARAEAGEAATTVATPAARLVQAARRCSRAHAAEQAAAPHPQRRCMQHFFLREHTGRRTSNVTRQLVATRPPRAPSGCGDACWWLQSCGSAHACLQREYVCCLQ